MQGSSIAARRDLPVGLLRLGHSQIARQRDHAAELRIEAFQAREVDRRQTLRCELSRFDPSRQLCDRRKRDVFVVCRRRVRGRLRCGTKRSCSTPTFWPGNTGGPIWLQARLRHPGKTFADRYASRKGERCSCSRCPPPFRVLPRSIRRLRASPLPRMSRRKPEHLRAHQRRIAARCAGRRQSHGCPAQKLPGAISSYPNKVTQEEHGAADRESAPRFL